MGWTGGLKPYLNVGTVSAAHDAPLEEGNIVTQTLHLKHPDLLRLLDLWQNKRRGEDLPGRAMFDPAELKFMLGHLLLVDLTAGGRLRVRLHGARLVDQMRHDHTGRFLDEWPYQPAKDDLLDACARVLDTRRPHAVTGRLASPVPVPYEALWLPLAGDGIAIDMLMCGKLYARRG